MPVRLRGSIPHASAKNHELGNSANDCRIGTSCYGANIGDLHSMADLPIFARSFEKEIDTLSSSNC